MGHLRPLRRNGRNFKCYLCSEWFDKYPELERHLKQAHNVESKPQ